MKIMSMKILSPFYLSTRNEFSCSWRFSCNSGAVTVTSKVFITPFSSKHSATFCNNFQFGVRENISATVKLLQDGSLFHDFEDPFAVWLEPKNIHHFFYFSNNKHVFQFVHFFPLNKFCILFPSKRMQKIQIVNKKFAWLHLKVISPNFTAKISFHCIYRFTFKYRKYG